MSINKNIPMHNIKVFGERRPGMEENGELDEANMYQVTTLPLEPTLDEVASNGFLFGGKLNSDPLFRSLLNGK
jgi:hypothetical protein